jgi:hypothetical protein
LINKPALLVISANAGQVERYASCFDASTQLGTLARQAGNRVIQDYLVLKVQGAPEGMPSDGCDRKP